MLTMKHCSCVIVLIISICVLNRAHSVNDVEQDADEFWPVLCAPDTFYSLKQHQCLPCSQCPVNKVIITQCQGFHNTKCGPFYDFKDLQPADQPPHAHAKFDSQHSNVLTSYEKTTNIHDYDLISKTNRQSSKHGIPHMEKTSTDTLELANDEWKYLTISLCVFLFILLMAILFVGIYLFRIKISNQKKIFYEYSPPEDV